MGDTDREQSSDRGPSKADSWKKGVEAMVSHDAKKKIVSILADVEKFTELEKLFLYLKLPTGEPDDYVNREARSGTPMMTVTRAEQTHAFNWIRSHLEESPSTSLPKHEVYEDYRAFCESSNHSVLSAADFGKIIKCVFPNIKARRLGTRGNSKYCYSGIRKKSEIKPPSLPNLEVPDQDMADSAISCICNCNHHHQEEDQTMSAASFLVCEWAQKLLGRAFDTLLDLARYLVGSNCVSTKSMAAFTVLADMDISSRAGKLAAGDIGLVRRPFILQPHQEARRQLQRKIQERKILKFQKEMSEQQSVSEVAARLKTEIVHSTERVKTVKTPVHVNESNHKDRGTNNKGNSQDGTFKPIEKQSSASEVRVGNKTDIPVVDVRPNQLTSSSNQPQTNQPKTANISSVTETCSLTVLQSKPTSTTGAKTAAVATTSICTATLTTAGKGPQTTSKIEYLPNMPPKHGAVIQQERALSAVTTVPISPAVTSATLRSPMALTQSLRTSQITGPENSCKQSETSLIAPQKKPQVFSPGQSPSSATPQRMDTTVVGHVTTIGNPTAIKQSSEGAKQLITTMATNLESTLVTISSKTGTSVVTPFSGSRDSIQNGPPIGNVSLGTIVPQLHSGSHSVMSVQPVVTSVESRGNVQVPNQSRISGNQISSNVIQLRSGSVVVATNQVWNTGRQPNGSSPQIVGSAPQIVGTAPRVVGTAPQVVGSSQVAGSNVDTKCTVTPSVQSFIGTTDKASLSQGGSISSSSTDSTTQNMISASPPSKPSDGISSVRPDAITVSPIPLSQSKSGTQHVTSPTPGGFRRPSVGSTPSTTPRPTGSMSSSPLESNNPSNPFAFTPIQNGSGFGTANVTVNNLSPIKPTQRLPATTTLPMPGQSQITTRNMTVQATAQKRRNTLSVQRQHSYPYSSNRTGVATRGQQISAMPAGVRSTYLNVSKESSSGTYMPNYGAGSVPFPSRPAVGTDSCSNENPALTFASPSNPGQMSTYVTGGSQISYNTNQPGTGIYGSQGIPQPAAITSLNRSHSAPLPQVLPGNPNAQTPWQLDHQNTQNYAAKRNLTQILETDHMETPLRELELSDADFEIDAGANQSTTGLLPLQPSYQPGWPAPQPAAMPQLYLSSHSAPTYEASMDDITADSVLQDIYQNPNSGNASGNRGNTLNFDLQQWPVANQDSNGAQSSMSC